MLDFQVYLDNNGFIWEKDNTIVENEDVLQYLYYTINLEDNFTLRSYFQTISYYSYLQLLDAFFLCYLREFQNCPKEGCLTSEFDYLALNRYASYESEKDIKVNSEVIPDIIEEDSVHFPEQIEMSMHFHAWSEKEDIPYAIDFCNLDELLDHEIKIGNSRVSIELEGNYEDYDSLSDKIIYREAKDETGYSLFEFIHAIIWELSFHGCKEHKKERKDELDRRISDFEKGE